MNPASAFFSSLLLLVTCSYLPADEYEIIPLYEINVEYGATQGTKVLEKNLRTVFSTMEIGLGIKRSKNAVPPSGVTVGRRDGKVNIGKKQMDATMVSWIPDRNPKPGTDAAEIKCIGSAKEIRFWTSKKINAPRMDLLVGWDHVVLPKSVVKFEYTSKSSDASSQPFTTVKGELLNSEIQDVNGKRVDTLVYSEESSSPETNSKGKVWLSNQVPGGFLKRESRVDRKSESGKILESADAYFRVVSFREETAFDEHVKVAAGRFAYKMPEGWKQVKPESKKEVLRLVRKTPDAKLNETIIVTAAKTKFESVQEFSASEFPKKSGLNDAKKYNHIPAGDFVIAAVPTECYWSWSPFESRSRTIALLAVRDGVQYEIAHWRDSKKEFDSTGQELTVEFIKSWRWMKKKETPAKK